MPEAERRSDDHPRPQPSAWLRSGAAALALAVAYYGGARLGLVLRFPPATTSVLWPPNALLTATLLMVAPRRWPLYLAAVFPAHVLVELQAGFPPGLVLALFFTNCLEALIAATLVHRWSDSPSRLDTMGRATAFLAGAVVVAPLVSTFADAAVVYWLRGEPFGLVALRRVYSNVASALTIAPAVLVIASGTTRVLRWTRLRLLEAAALAGSLIVVGQAVFSGHGAAAGLPGVPDMSRVFIVPFLLWATVRFGAGGASLAMLTTALLAIRAATLGLPSIDPLSPEEGVVALQAFIVIVGVPFLYLSALLEERATVSAALAERLRYEEVLSRLWAAFVNVGRLDAERVFGEALGQLGRFAGADRVMLQSLSAGGELAVVHQWIASPEARAAPRSRLDWFAARLRSAQLVAISDPAEVPADASAERQYLHDLGGQALLMLPLGAAEQVHGCLCLASSKKGAWPRSLLERGHLLANVFAEALARQGAESALRESEAMKAAVLDSLTSQVAVLDRRGRIVRTNDSWQRSARGGDGLEGLGDLGSDHLEYWRRMIRRGFAEASLAEAGLCAVLDGAMQIFALEYPSPDQRDRWYFMTGVPLRSPQGGAVVSLTDVSERKRAELEAQKSRQELAHFLRVSTIGELTGSLAHELNQPLTAILANAQAACRLLEAGDRCDHAELGAMMRDIVEDDRRAGDVIRRLRGLLRKAETERRLLDANALVRGVVTLLASDAALRGLTVRSTLHPTPLWILGDRVQIEQVLLNLLINAMDAMATDAGGVVSVEARRSGDGAVQIAVADSGPGVSSPTQVFEPFFTTKPEGLGMGLSIAQSIVRAHSGTIEAANNAGRGATFTVSLPAAALAAGDGHPDALPREAT